MRKIALVIFRFAKFSPNVKGKKNIFAVSDQPDTKKVYKIQTKSTAH